MVISSQKKTPSFQIQGKMPTQLAAQLQRLHVANADVTDLSSILFSPQEASRLNLQSIYSIGRNGIMELIRIDDRFARFDDTLFGNKLLSVNRNHLTEAENESINEQIRDYLFSVAPYMLLKCTQKTLEYLIRRFSIHTFNAEDFFLAVLPFHESPFFPKVFKILTLKNPIFNFLANAKKAETPIIRSSLSNQCLKDYGFLEFIISGLQRLNQHSTIPVVHLTLICSIVVDMTRQGSLKEEYVRTLIHFASSGFLSTNVEYQATSLLILSEVSMNVRLSDEIVNACLKNYLKTASNVMQLLECLLIMFRTNEEYIMPEEIAELLLMNPSFEKTLSILALKVSVFPVIRVMIPSLCKLFMGKRELTSQLDCFNKCIQEKEAESYIQLIMNQLAVLAQQSQNGESIERIMLSLSSQFSSLFDQFISTLSTESPLKALSSRLFYGSSHMLLSNGRTLYLSMDCHEYSIRKEICELVLKQLENEKDMDLAFLKDCIPSLLRDHFFDISFQLLSVDAAKLLKVFSSSELIGLLLSLLEDQALLSHLNDQSVQQVLSALFSLLHSVDFASYVVTLTDQQIIAIIRLFYSYYLAESLNDSLKKIVLSVIVTIPSMLTRFKSNIKAITKEKIVDALTHSFVTEENIDLFLQALPLLIDAVPYCSLFFMEIALSFIAKNSVKEEVKMEIGDALCAYCFRQLQSQNMKITEQDLKPMTINNLVSSSLYLSGDDLAKYYISVLFVIGSTLKYPLSSMIEDYPTLRKHHGHPLSIIIECFSVFTPQTSFYMTLCNCIVSTVWPTNPTCPYCVVLACSSESTITLHALNKLLTVLSVQNSISSEVYGDLFIASFGCLQSSVMASRSTSLMILTQLLNKTQSMTDDRIVALNELIAAVMKFKSDIKDDPKLFTIKLQLILSKQMVNVNRLSMVLYSLILQQVSLQQRVTYLTLFKTLPYVSSLEETVLRSIQTTFSLFQTSPSELVIEEWKLLLTLFFKAMTLTMGHQKEFRSLLYSFITTDVVVSLRNGSVYSPITDVLRLINKEVFDSMNTPEKLSLIHALFAVVPHHPSIDAIDVYNSIIQLDVPLALFVDEARTLASASEETEKEELISIQLMTVFIEIMTRDPRFNNSLSSIDPLLIILNRLVSIVKEHTPVKETATMMEQRAVEGAMEIESELHNENTAIMSDTLAVFYPIQILLECLYSIIESSTSNVRPIPEENNPPSKRARRNSISVRAEIAIPPQVLVDLIHLNLTTQIKKTCLQLLSLLASLHNKEMDNHLFACFEELASRVISHLDEESFSVIISVLTYCLRRFDNQVQILRIYKTFLSCVPYLPYSHSIQLLNTLITYSSSEYIGHITAYLLLLNNGMTIMKKEKGEMEIEEDATRLQSSATATSSIYHFITTMFMAFNLMPQIRALSVLCCFAEIITEPENGGEGYSNKTRDLTVYLMNSLPVEEWKEEELNTIIISSSMLQFVHDIVSHTTFINKVATEKMNVEKSQQFFMQIIENLLLVLQNCSTHKDRIGEESRGREKTEQEMVCLTKYKELEGCIYDCITVFSEVMNVTTLLTILSVLIKHEDASVRKRSLVMLNKKIEDNINDFTPEEVHEFITFMDNLMEIWNDKNEQSTNKQTALLSLHVLVQYFGMDYAADFLKCVPSILAIVKDTQTNTPAIQALKGSAYIALSMLCSQLGIRMLPHLPVLLPSLLTELENSTQRMSAVSEEIAVLTEEVAEGEESSKRALRERTVQYEEICLLMQSLLSSLSSIITYQGSLLSSFLQRIIVSLLSPILVANTKQSIKGAVLMLLDLLSEKIETRLLLPAVYESYKKVDSHASASLCGVFILLKDLFDRQDEETIAPIYEKAWSFCVMGLELRTKWGVLNTEIESVEKCIVDTMISITLKLNENQLTPLFMKTVNWMESKTSVTSEEELPPMAKVIPFLTLVIELSNSFKSIFTPFYAQFFPLLVEYLALFNKNCRKEKEISEDQLALFKTVKQVILALYKCFLYDSNGWMDEEKFKLVSSPLVKCIGSYFVPNYETEYGKFMNKFVVPTCIQLIISTSGHDEWWQQYNHEVLIQTRSSFKQVILVAIRVIRECFERLSQEYLPLLPDVIPFLADLLEDEDAEVEKAAQDLRVQLEAISGEELSSYLTM